MRTASLRTASAVALALASSLATRTALAETPIQVDIQAVGVHPNGEFLEFDEFRQLDDLLDFGYGFRGDVMFGLTNYLYLGGQGGWFRSNAGKAFNDFEFDLDSYPVHGLVQLRAQHVIGLFAQAGAGFTHQKAKGDVVGAFEASQNSFSWLAGGGISLGLPGPIALTAGVDYNAINPGDGDLWSKDDKIRFWMFSAGIRFHTK